MTSRRASLRAGAFLCAGLLLVGGVGFPRGAGSLDAPLEAERLARGAELYRENCAVCHGKAAGGLAEARLSFPPDERQCTRCHRPSNRVVQPLSQPFIDNDMFSIGLPPALVPEVGQPPPMPATASPTALWAYMSLTMPRYEPGRQTAEEYWLLTAYLLDLNGRPEAAAEALASSLDAAAPDEHR